MKSITFTEFRNRLLKKDLRDSNNKKLHTRFIKKYFVRFAKELLKYYGFNMYKCFYCGLRKWGKYSFIKFGELHHLNRKTNDSRLRNLKPSCPNCHSITDGYKNRKYSLC